MSVTQSWQQCRTAQFSATWSAAGTVVTVDGELDAANSDQLASYVQRNARHARRVILDLRALNFIGTAGFSALHRINVVCSGARLSWALVPSPAVCRLLRVCDPDGTLPVTTPIEEPLLETVWPTGPDARPLLQLVAQAR
ncbi:sulfate transporter [Mycobacterium triplex]|uniref:STAS domain-containing protein n=1 Tax=Mycobacterium triplex TaxID=47839 RepID=A0A024JUL1_9MYCO|nr:STAS domain-containing protein [Mycobacterium triplex]ORX02886.1 sulfate transporter [Mycobacterium triplex]CDO87306.1 STAS domain-containing protein [Mycobacterium triplex]